MNYKLANSIDPQEEFERAVLRIYGVNDNQNSVMIHVHNFRSYFFVDSPPELDPTKENLEDLKNQFNVYLRKYLNF